MYGIPMVVIKSFSVLRETKAKDSRIFRLSELFGCHQTTIKGLDNISHCFCDSLCNKMYRDMGIHI